MTIDTIQNSDNKDELMEKMIFQLLFKDEEIRFSLQPYLNTEIFEAAAAKNLWNDIESFNEEFGTFPTLKDMKLKINDTTEKNFLNSCFVGDANIEDYDKDHVIGSVENHVKEIMFKNQISDLLVDIDDQTFNISEESDLPEKMREIMSFSFDNSVGFDLFSPEGIEHMAEFFHSASKYVPSGIVGLDEMLGGGFHAKSLSLFMLATNKGKSAIKGSIGANIVMQGKNVLYITLEMSEEMIGKRIMSNIFDVQLKKLATLHSTTLQKQFEKVANICAGRFKIKEYPTGDMNSNKIRRLLKELDNKQDWKPDIIFVDYLGLMKTNRARKTSAKHEDLKTVSEELRDIGMEYDIPIVSSMQTNREGYDSADLDLSDMSESFGVAMTADVTIAGVMNEELRVRKEYIWRCIKNRFGDVQKEINVGMDFDKMKLSDLGDMPRNTGEAGDFQHRPLHGMETSALDAIEEENASDSDHNFKRETGFEKPGRPGKQFKTTGFGNFD